MPMVLDGEKIDVVVEIIAPTIFERMFEVI